MHKRDVVVCLLLVCCGFFLWGGGSHHVCRSACAAWGTGTMVNGSTIDGGVVTCFLGLFDRRTRRAMMGKLLCMLFGPPPLPFFLSFFFPLPSIIIAEETGESPADVQRKKRLSTLGSAVAGPGGASFERTQLPNVGQIGRWTVWVIVWRWRD